MARHIVLFVCPDCSVSPEVRGITERAGVVCARCDRHFGMIRDLCSVGMASSRPSPVVWFHPDSQQ